jgi:hypothetical protein
MPPRFQYKPKFRDIRVRPPKEGEAEAREDVNALKPGERACAAEYNRNWDFFAGMSEGEVRRRQQDEAFTGGRPTWEMKAGRMSREAAAFSAKFGKGEGYRDPFNMFGGAAGPRPAPEPEARKLGKIERNALAELDLDAGAEPAAIRTRYTELVRRLHPDANGGDRAGEQRLQKVIRAYQALRKTGMA